MSTKLQSVQRWIRNSAYLHGPNRVLSLSWTTIPVTHMKPTYFVEDLRVPVAICVFSRFVVMNGPVNNDVMSRR